MSGRARSILAITNATEEDAGYYECKAGNYLGSHRSESHLVRVIGMSDYTTINE